MSKVALFLWLLTNAPPVVNTYSNDENERLETLRYQAEDLQHFRAEWRRFWFADQPAHLTHTRIYSSTPILPPGFSSTPAFLPSVATDNSPNTLTRKEQRQLHKTARRFARQETPTSTSPANESTESLIFQSEDLGRSRAEWWFRGFTNPPSHMTYDRIHGGIGP